MFECCILVNIFMNNVCFLQSNTWVKVVCVEMLFICLKFFVGKVQVFQCYLCDCSHICLYITCTIQFVNFRDDQMTNCVIVSGITVLWQLHHQYQYNAYQVFISMPLNRSLPPQIVIFLCQFFNLKYFLVKDYGCTESQMLPYVMNLKAPTVFQTLP